MRYFRSVVYNQHDIALLEIDIFYEDTENVVKYL